MDASDAEQDAYIILHQMRERWSDERAAHLTDVHQERVIVAWARLRLIDQYAREFAKQKRTYNTSHNQGKWDATADHGPDGKRPQNASDTIIDRKQEDDSKRLSNMERAEVESLVDRLPHTQRSIVKLLLYDGLTQQEAAEKLGVTQPAVHAGYQRAQDALREMLAEYKDFV